MSEATSGIGRSSLLIAAGTAASRLTGFLRVFALAYALGQSTLGDLYTKANAAPNLLYELVVGGVLSATLVPVFVAARERDDDEATSVVLSVGFVAAVTLAVLALGGAWLAELGLTRHFESLAGTNATSLTRVRIGVDLVYLMLPQILFYGISTLCTGYLNASRRFLTAAFAPVATNVFTIGAFILVGRQLQGRSTVLDATAYDRSVLMWLGLGTTGGIVAMTIPVMFAVRRSDVAFRFLPRRRHWAVSQIVRMGSWTFGYVVANQLALLAVVLLLDRQKRYSDAFIFFQLPHGLIAVSVMTALTTELASVASRQDYQAFADRFVGGLRLLAVLIIPAAVGYVVLATPITSFLAIGNLTTEDARLTAHVVVAFAVGLPAFSTYLFACRGFYALSNTKTPFLLNVVENGLNIAALVVLIVVGARSSTTFAAAYSLAYIVAAALALWRLDVHLRRLDPDFRRPDLAPFAKMAAAATAMGLAVWAVRIVLDADNGAAAVVSVAVSVLVGGAVYAVVGSRLSIAEIDDIIGQVRRRFNR